MALPGVPEAVREARAIVRRVAPGGVCASRRDRPVAGKAVGSGRCQCMCGHGPACAGSLVREAPVARLIRCQNRTEMSYCGVVVHW